MDGFVGNLQGARPHPRKRWHTGILTPRPQGVRDLARLSRSRVVLDALVGTLKGAHLRLCQ